MISNIFRDFQELKYNNIDEWKLTKYNYKLRKEEVILIVFSIIRISLVLMKESTQVIYSVALMKLD